MKEKKFIYGGRKGAEMSYAYKTPAGMITLSCDEEAITELLFGAQYAPKAAVGKTKLIEEAMKQLDEYFEGKRKEFDLPLKPKGTPFQLKDWEALCAIPYGETCTYKDIAVAIGNEKACRAVGLANNRNPISIIIPCHRVVGSNGKLVGYGGGLDTKEYLLRLEQTNIE